MAALVGFVAGQRWWRRAAAVWDARLLSEAAKAAGPPLLFGLRLWASVCLALYVAFWLELDNAYWAGTSAAIVCQPQLGASLRKGWFRMVGTVVGAMAIVVLTACFPQDRALFLGGLALWAAICAFTATLLRNFASYAAALAGYTAAIIASDQLGSTGGVNGDALMLAITRASEICIGIVSAGVVLGSTDLRGARRRLAALFAELSARIAARFAGMLAMAGGDLPETTNIRRDFIRQVIALEPVIDQALGESSQMRYHSPLLQKAVDGLFAALTGWRAVANHLARLSPEQAGKDAAVVLERVPPELRASLDADLAQRWLAEPIVLYRICEIGVRRLLSLRAETPSIRLLADGTAEALTGIAQTLNGLALLVRDPARPLPRSVTARLHIADWLPAWVNGARALTTILAVALLWIATEWPNGAQAMAFAAISIILFAPRAEQASAVATSFTVGAGLSAIFAAIIGFAVIPGLQTFPGFSLALGLVLVPAGAGIAQPWQTPMFTGIAAYFCPLLGPGNQMSYDTLQFYNSAVAVLAGFGAAALSFRLIPPLSPAYRARRLLALSLRDLRRLAARRGPGDWQDHMHGRLAAMPEEATPLQRAQLLAALSLGRQIIRLRHVICGLGPRNDPEPAFAAIASGDGGRAITELLRLDAALASRSAPAAQDQAVLRARASVIVLLELLRRHPEYFGARIPR